MADSKSSGAPPEEPAEAARRDKQAWDDLEATLRALDLLDPRTPVERARDAIRKGAAILRQHGEAEEADKVIAAVGPGRRQGAPRSYTEDEGFRLVRDIHEIVEMQSRPSLNAAAKMLAERGPYKSSGQSAHAIRVRYGEYFRRQWEDIPADERPPKRPEPSQVIRAVWRRGKSKRS